MSQHVLGIDFGASQATSIVADAGADPRAIMTGPLPIVTPCVFYMDRGGEPLVGDEAVEPACASPERAVLGIHEGLQNPKWKRKIDGVKLKAEDLAALLFQRIASDTHQSDTKMSTAVIAVPASSHDGFRQTVLDAASGAGIPVMRLINEPTAAGLAYASITGLSGQVLVLGLGHDFDVMVLEVASPESCTVLASNGLRAKPNETQGVPVDRVAKTIARALKDVALEPSELDGVIVTGERGMDSGLHELIREQLGRQPHNDLDPVDVVARGAAACAAMLARDGMTKAA